jgi:hypothetical protein
VSEGNIFRPSLTRRAVTASGLPLGHCFQTSREMKDFLEDSDQFIEECLQEKSARDGNQAQLDDNLEGQRLPSQSNQRSKRRKSFYM